MAIRQNVQILFFNAVLYVALAAEKSQMAVLFDQFDGTGRNIVIHDTYKSDLTEVSFDNLAHSACVTGIWIFYADPNFNPTGGRPTEYIFGRDNYCVNFKVVHGGVSSMRYAGHPKDYTIDSLTIYQHSFFQGKEEYAFNELERVETLKGDHQSIIITGCNDWTVFDQPNFQGNSICLRMPSTPNGTVVPAFLDDLQDHIGGPIRHGSIQSARKGCRKTSGASIKMSSFSFLG